MSQQEGEVPQTTDTGGDDGGDVELAGIPASNPVSQQNLDESGDGAVAAAANPGVVQGDTTTLPVDQGDTVQGQGENVQVVPPVPRPPPPPATASGGGGGARQEDADVGAPRRNIPVQLIYITVIAMALATILALSVVIVRDDDGDATSAPVSITPQEQGEQSSTTSPPTASPVQEAGVREDDVFVEGDNLAEMPQQIVDFLTETVFLPPGSDGLRLLALPPDMLSSLNGQCSTLDQYSAAENTNYWQCGSTDANLNFPLPDDLNSDKTGIPYRPTDEVLSLMANATGVSLESLRRMNITSGQPNSPLGAWCGMPAAGFSELETLSPQDLLAYNYWLTCVAPRAGYFNALQCKGLCIDEHDENCTSYAVLGYAAMESSVCYPAHQHAAQEAYWQIAGRGWWRTWNGISGLDEYDYATNDNFGGSQYALHTHRRYTPHEFDTTSNLDGDGGAGTLAEPMVMIYWWGLPTSISNNYTWVSEVRDRETTFQYQPSATSCGDRRRIPVFQNGTLQEITVDNC